MFAKFLHLLFKIVHAQTNCDGYKKEGITFPSSEIQKRLLQDFYNKCKVDPSTVSYVEAHGTGELFKVKPVNVYG